MSFGRYIVTATCKKNGPDVSTPHLQSIRVAFDMGCQASPEAAIEAWKKLKFTFGDKAEITADLEPTDGAI